MRCGRRRIGATDADHAEWNDAFWNDASRRVRGADHHHVWAYDDDDGDDDDDGGDDDNDDDDKMTRRIITTKITIIMTRIGVWIGATHAGRGRKAQVSAQRQLNFQLTSSAIRGV